MTQDLGNGEEVNPIEDLIDQLESLLKVIESKKNVPINDLQVTADMMKRLRKVQSRVKKFNKISEDIVALSDVSREEMLKRQANQSTELTPEGKRLIEKANRLRLHAESMRDDFELPQETTTISDRLPLSDNKSEFERIQETKSDAKSIKKRRSKFRQMGTDQDWKLL